MISYYFLIVLLVFLGMIRYKNRDNYVVYIVSAYCLVGLLPINTTYRGIVSEHTYLLWFLAMLMLLIGMFLDLKLKFKTIAGRNTKKLGLTLLLLHVAIVYLSLLFVYINTGPIIINQELRLQVNPFLAYIIKSISPLSLLYIKQVRFIRNRVVFLGILILPSVLIGARGVAMIYLLGWVIVTSKETNKSILQFLGRRGLLMTAFAFVFILFSGFYFRHNGSNLSTVSSLMDNYFVGTGDWIIPLLPIFLGLREVIGISNYIFTHEVVNTWTSLPLIFQELVTLLPGEQVAPGRIISGQVFGLGSSVDKGYTPGIIAAFYLDGGIGGIALGMFVSGALLSLSRSMNISISTYLALSFLHLFHRGFIKPEYIFHLLILIFYLFLIYGDNSKRLVRGITRDKR